MRLLAAILPVVLLLPVVVFRWAPPAVTGFMLENRWEVEREQREDWVLTYQWVALSEISPEMALAVVAAEDQKFPDHHGFDFEAISDAWDEYQSGKRRRGASTISQQVARNMFLWRGGGFVRKGLEAVYTALIETLWPKRRILEVYLNVAEFGDGVYGVGAASEAFFAKPPSELTRREAALLAAVLPSPTKMHAGRPSSYVLKRARMIERFMRQLGPDHLDGII